MSEKYTGQDRRYTGSQVDITYNVKRCIHAAYCVTQLASVFDNQKRPWIQADNASADEIAVIIQRCPSGALHYERKDGGAAEQAPDTNTVVVWKNGPLQISGNISLNGASVALDAETRMTLCRCGASRNKPFCDNSHKDIGFSAHEVEPVGMETVPASGQLNIASQPDGPLEIDGSLQIHDEAGNVLFAGSKTALCRCGSSGKKPFCDGSHKRIGFKAD
jgi:CDGSH-type Zn-finger protein/uncharacterized Fe-S cluster protein YjdI